MKRLRISIITALGVLSLMFTAKSQDVNFSQYFSTPMYYNPAFTGVNTGFRARFLYRNQWPSLPQSYKSYFFSADLGDRGLPGAGGLGIYVNSYQDGYAFIKNLDLGLNLSVRIPITAYMVSQLGIKAAIGQRSVNWSELVFPDQLSELYGNIYVSSQLPGAEKSTYPDFGVGGLVQFANPEGTMTGSAGLSVDHIFQPDVAFYSNNASLLPRKIVLHGDLVYSAGGGTANMSYGGNNDPLKINPGVVYQSQNGLSALQVGLNLLKFNIYLGAWYKSTMGNNPNTAMTLLAGYRYNVSEDMSVRFIYSYDLQVSGNLNNLGGAHEISLVLEFGNFGLTGSSGGRNNVFGTSGGRGGRNSPLECPSFY